ncbi:unnamed protein product [Protopolystoma xenopodis]|uniref:G-protein coupled receptors family 1 profile domain-containing protein n=1 Tax=Protopolystoma xenopodis TaxID=117903 RepID=A0A448XDB0_9PLAT|nr:unnamed protein product [Protopolystoma xenopodis]
MTRSFDQPDCADPDIVNYVIGGVGLAFVSLGLIGGFLSGVILLDPVLRLFWPHRPPSQLSLMQPVLTTVTGSSQEAPGSTPLAIATASSANQSAGSTSGSSAFRSSTLLLMQSMALVDMIGLLTSCLRYTVLCLTRRVDLRRLSGVAVCQIHIFLSYSCQDASIWLLCYISAERFYLMLRPTSDYSARKTWLTPTLIGLACLAVASVGKNLFLITRQPDICPETYQCWAFFMIDFFFKLVLPFCVLMFANIGLLCLITRNVKPSQVGAAELTTEPALAEAAASASTPASLGVNRSVSFCLDQVATSVLASGPGPRSAEARGRVSSLRSVSERGRRASGQFGVPRQALIASRMMMMLGLLHLVTSPPALLFKLTFPQYQHMLSSATGSCGWLDFAYNAVSVIFWCTSSIKFYLYLLASPRMRADLLRPLTLRVGRRSELTQKQPSWSRKWPNWRRLWR